MASSRLCSAMSACRTLLNNRNSFVNSQQSVAFISKKRIDELADKVQSLSLPLKPKKPLTPYFQYLTKERQHIRAENPTIDPRTVVKQVAVQWETVDEQTKNKLKEQFRIEQKEYSKQMLAYEAKLSSEQRTALIDLKKATSERTVKIRQRKELRSLGKPKRPASAFMLFIKSKLAGRGTMQFADFQRKIADEWKTLNQEQRKPFQAEFEKDQQRYGKEMKEWEQRMVREGNENLVRKTKSLNVSIRTQKKNKTQ